MFGEERLADRADAKRRADLRSRAAVRAAGVARRVPPPSTRRRGVVQNGSRSTFETPHMTRFAALQTVSTPDVDRNLEAAGRLVAQAVKAGATWAALPEYFCLMGRRDDDKLAIAEAD